MKMKKNPRRGYNVGATKLSLSTLVGFREKPEYKSEYDSPFKVGCECGYIEITMAKL